MKIRKAKKEEWKDIRSLNKKLFDYDTKNDPSLNPDWPFSEPAQQYYKNAVTDDSFFTLVAEDNGKIVAYVIISLCVELPGVELPEIRKDIVLAELENMYVEESFRGTGIGSALVSEAEKWAKAKGANRLKAVASSENTMGRAFYERAGFSEYDITYEKIL